MAHAQAHPGKVCLVVLHESVTRGFSASNNKGAQISNCLFRLNGAALILTNRCVWGECLRAVRKRPTWQHTSTVLAVWGPRGEHRGSGCACRPQDMRRAKYELLYTEKTLLTTDEAFNSIKVRRTWHWCCGSTARLPPSACADKRALEVQCECCGHAGARG